MRLRKNVGRSSASKFQTETLPRILASGRPGLIVAGRLGPAAACQRRSGWPIGRGRARHVWNMRLFPLARLVALFRRRHVDGVVHPAVPRRRDAACLGRAVIDHPAPLEVERGIDLAASGPIIAVALFVLADQLAEPPGPQLGAKGLAVPPSEELEKELFHPPADAL